jgi:hypothetical protein
VAPEHDQFGGAAKIRFGPGVSRMCEKYSLCLRLAIRAGAVY